MNKSSIIMGILTVATLGMTPLHAGTRIWNNSGTDWGTADNWSGGVPGNTDAATFGAGTPANQPTIGSPVSVGQVVFAGTTNGVISGAALTLMSTGNDRTVTNGTGPAILANVCGTNMISANIVLGSAPASTMYVGKVTAGTTILSGNISDNGNGVALGEVGAGATSILVLSGSNSFGGGVVHSASVLEIGSDTAIPATGLFKLNGPATPSYLTLKSSGTSTRTVGNSLQLSGAHVFCSDTPPNTGNIVFTNAGTLTADLTVNAKGPSSGLDVGAVAFEGSLGEDAAGRSLTVGDPNVGSYGYVFLLGSNSYSGPTTLGKGGSVGPVVINSIADVGAGASSLGAPGNTTNGTIALAVNANVNANLRYVGGPATTDRVLALTTNTTANASTVTLDASGKGAIAFRSALLVGGTSTGARNLKLDGTSSASNTVGGAIPNAPSAALNLTKIGTGTWVLQGANTFTGGVTVSSGRLVLDYSNNATVLAANNDLTFNGGTLALLAKGGTASSQTLGNLTLTTDKTRSAIELSPNGPGSSMTLTLGGTWTRNNNLVSLYLKVPSGTTLNSPLNVWNGFWTTNGLVTYAVVEDGAGIGFATTNGVGNVVRYTSAIPLPAGTTDGTKNYSLSGSLNRTATAANNVYTLAVDTTGGGTLNLNGYGLDIKGLLFTGTGNYVVTNGNFNQGQNDGTVLYHQYSSGLVTLWAEAQGTGFTGTKVAKDGPGTLVLKKKDNGWPGALSVLEGAVRVDFADISKWTNNVALNGGGVLELGATGNFTNSLGTGNNQVQILGDGGFGAYGETRTVRLNNGTASIDWNSASFVPNNNALVLGGKDSDSMVDFQNGLNFGNQQRVVRVNDGSAAIDARLSGVLSGRYGGGLIKDGAGTLELTADNTYVGDTWVRDGTLKVNNAGGSGTGSGTVTVFGGGAIGGTGTVSRLALAGGTMKVDVTGGTLEGTLTVTGTLGISEGSTLEFVGSGLQGGPYVIAQPGNLTGSEFTVVNMPAGYVLKYHYQGGNAIVLEPSGRGTMLIIH